MFQLNHVDFEALAARKSANAGVPTSNKFFYQKGAIVRVVSSYMQVWKLLILDMFDRGYYLHNTDNEDFKEGATVIFGSCFGTASAPHFKMTEETNYFVFESRNNGSNLLESINKISVGTPEGQSKKKFAMHLYNELQTTASRNFKLIPISQLLSIIKDASNSVEFSPARAKLLEHLSKGSTKIQLLASTESEKGSKDVDHYRYPTSISDFQESTGNKVDIQVIPFLDNGVWRIQLKFSKAFMEQVVPSGTTDPRRRFAEIWEWFNLLAQSLVRGPLSRQGRKKKDGTDEDEESNVDLISVKGSVIGPVLYMPVGTAELDNELYSNRAHNSCTLTADYKVHYTVPVSPKKLGETIDAKAALVYCLNEIGMPMTSVDSPYNPDLFLQLGRPELYKVYEKANATLFRNRGSVLEVNWAAGIIAKLGKTGNLVVTNISGSAPLTDEPIVVSIEGNDSTDLKYVNAERWDDFSLLDYISNTAILFCGLNKYSKNSISIPSYEKFFDGGAPFFAQPCQLQNKPGSRYKFDELDREAYNEMVYALNDIQSIDFVQAKLEDIRATGLNFANKLYNLMQTFKNYSYLDNGLELGLPWYYGPQEPMSNVRIWEQHSVAHRLIGFISRVCATNSLAIPATIQSFFDNQELTRPDIAFEKCVSIWAMYLRLNEWDTIKSSIETVRANRSLTKDSYPKTPQDIENLRVAAPYISDQMMTHQAVVLNVLDKTVPDPETLVEGQVSGAIADIQPGGGKTYIGMAEIFMLMHKNYVKKPVVVMPASLIANWAQEIRKFTNNQVNVLAISSNVLRNWETYDNKLLTKIINNLPPNSIVLTTVTALRATNRSKAYLNRTIPDFKLVRILSEWGADFMAVDESHVVKNAATSMHMAVTALRNLKTMKFVRLLSGTLVSNTPADLPGQLQLINPYTLSDTANFADRYMKGTLLKPGMAPIVRQKVNEGVTMTSVRRTEWVHMLPETIEDIHYIRAPEEGDGAVFIQIYRAMLEASIFDLQNAAKDKGPKGAAARKALGILTGEKPVSDEDDEDSEEGSESITGFLDNALSALEQFCIDPQGLIQASVAKSLGKDNAALEAVLQKYSNVKIPPSPKITDPQNGLLALLKQHFATEPEGLHCVLIICHHIRGVQALYNALAPYYKDTIVVASKGDTSDLESFGAKKKILIGTEGTIGTGLNLQAASRLIRMEIPWTSGRIEQTLSRVVRPTPPRMIDGKVVPDPRHRDKVWLDWLVTENTFEVAKMTRIISKIITNEQFYLADEPSVTSIDSRSDLVGRMNAENFREFFSFKQLGIIFAEKEDSSGNKVFDEDGNPVIERRVLADSFAGSYVQLLNAKKEIYERETKDRLRMMVPVKRLPPPKDAELIDLEVIPLPLTQEDLIGANSGKVPKGIEKIIDAWVEGRVPNKPLDKFVDTDSGKSIVVKKKKKSKDSGFQMTDEERRKFAKEQKRLLRKQQKEREEAERLAQEEAERLRKEQEAERIRKEQEAKNRIKPPRSGGPATTPRPDTQTDLPGVQLWLEIYNGMLAISIEATDEADYKQLKPLGFKKVPPHLVGRVENANKLKTFRAAMERRAIKLMGKEELASIEALQQDFNQARNNPQLLNHARYFYTFVNTIKPGQAYFFPIIDADRRVWLMGRKGQGIGARTVGGITFTEEGACYTAVFTSKKAAQAAIAALRQLYSLTNGEEVAQILNNWNIKKADGPTQSIRQPRPRTTEETPPADVSDEEVRFTFAQHISSNAARVGAQNAKMAMSVLLHFEVIPANFATRITNLIRSFQAGEIGDDVVINLLVTMYQLYEAEINKLRAGQSAPQQPVNNPQPAVVTPPSATVPPRATGPRIPVRTGPTVQPATLVNQPPRAPRQPATPAQPAQPAQPVTRNVPRTTPRAAPALAPAPVITPTIQRAPTGWNTDPATRVTPTPSIRISPATPGIRLNPRTPTSQTPRNTPQTRQGFSLDDDEELV